MPTQAEKGRVFRALHERDGAFIVPNPWDVGTALLLAHLGFEAVATTSMGYAFSLGRLDNTLDREETLANASAIASATRLPVSADLENGFGDAPEEVAETIRLAAAAGVVGGSIEDATGRSGQPIYEMEKAVERVRAPKIICTAVRISKIRSGGCRRIRRRAPMSSMRPGWPRRMILPQSSGPWTVR
jgi:2-methylisocitrate lyase-like PEP mutase family enzyme